MCLRKSLLSRNMSEMRLGECPKGAEQPRNSLGKGNTKNQFSMERNEINQLDVSLARAGAAITVRSAGALMELEEAARHWHNLGR